MMSNPLGSEQFALVGVIDPGAKTVDTYGTAWIKADKFEQYTGIVLAGAMGSADGTIDAKFQCATAVNGANAKTVTGKEITQFTKATPDFSNKQAIINLRTEELDATFTFIRFVVVVGAQTSGAAAVLLGSGARYDPASASDAATVVEIVK
jgi:hypothetical protein